MKRAVGVFLIVVCTALMSGGAEQVPTAQPHQLVEQPFPPGDVPLLRLQNENMTVSAAMGIVSAATRWQIICTAKAGAVRFGLWAQDMKASDLVRGIVKSQGLTYRVEGSTIYIMARDELNQSFGAGKLVVQLRNAPADRMATALQPLLSGSDAKVAALPEAGSVVIYDTPANLDVLRQLVGEIDRPLQDAAIQLANAPAAELAKTLQGFASPIGKVTASESSNQLIVSDVAGRVAMIEKMAKQLDQPALRQTRQFPLRNAECTTVAQYLADMFGLRKGLPSELVVRSTGPGATAPPAPAEQIARPAYRSIDTLAEGLGSSTGTVSAVAAAPSTPSPAVPSAPTPQTPATVPSRDLGSEVQAAESSAGQGTVVADIRANSVWVTENPERLRQIAEVVAGLDVPMVTKSYKFNYADPAGIGIEDRLAMVLLSPFDHFEVDPATRRVTVTSTPEKVAQTIDLFREWDVRPAQVFIAGKLMSVSRRRLEELGVTFDVLFSKNMDEHIGTAVDVKGTFPPTFPAVPRGSVKLGDLATDNFTALLEALENDSRTKVLSSPRVMVLDGSKATFTDATEEPYTEVVIAGETNTTIQNVKFKNVGVTVNVQPRIGSQNQIAMSVSMEVSSLVEFRSGVPVIASSRMSSDVVVADGRPLVIGGLIDDQDTRAHSGVPLISRIPIIGLLFSNTRSDRSQRELVIVIVPTIVGPRVIEPEPTLDSIDKDLTRADYLKGESAPESGKKGPGPGFEPSDEQK